jgi:hypothetical protein
MARWHLATFETKLNFKYTYPMVEEIKYKMRVARGAFVRPEQMDFNQVDF